MVNHSPLSPHLSFIHQRLPAWLAAAPAPERRILHERIRASHAAMRRLDEALAPVQDIEAFCKPLLEAALSCWFPTRARPDVDSAWVWHAGLALSWFEAALQNFDADDTISLHDSSSSLVRRTGEDAARFVRGVRNLDLGQRYLDHLADHIDTDAFRAQVRQQDRAAFAAELKLAHLQGHLDNRGAWMGETLFAGLATPANTQLNAAFLSLSGIALNGPLLITLQSARAVRSCLLYLPGHPFMPLRQYDSPQAVNRALSELLWRQDQRQFFKRYVGHAEQPRFAIWLQKTLYPRYPYSQLHPSPPTLEKGQRFDWFRQVFPATSDIWQETLDKTARLQLTATPWLKDAFSERARVEVQRRLQDAASIAVPVAQRDAAAQVKRLEHWLGIGLGVLNLASFFVPGLGEAMLVIGGAQLVDEFLDGVHDANEGDAEAAIGHLFDIVEALAQFAALGASTRLIEPQGILQTWNRVGPPGKQRLWHGELAAFARPRPWPDGLQADAQGLHAWRGRPWLERGGLAMPLERSADGTLSLVPARSQWHRPTLMGNGQGSWLLEHERPLAWRTNTLLEHLGPVVRGIDARSLERALRCSGYDATVLRKVLLDRRPIPALLGDSLEMFGGRGHTTRLADSAALERDFPTLGARACDEIITLASPPERAQMTASGRVPLRLAEMARLYLRERRISETLAHFYQHPQAAADLELLVFATLERLPGWPQSLRIELRESGLPGHLLAAIGEPGQELRTLVRSTEGYTPYDQRGEALAGRQDIFRALLQALPDRARDSLDLRIHEGQALRDRLFELAASNRSQAAADLGLPPVRPMYRLPTRLPGERHLGYRLSGRGRGAWSEDELFDQLYPATAQGDREMLRQRLRHQAGPRLGAFGRLLERLLTQYSQLDTDLQRWVQETDSLAPGVREQQRMLRDTQSQRIRGAWRRESQEGPHDNIDDINLALEGHGLTSLPRLLVRLPHVRALTITGYDAPDAAGLNELLGAFPGVRLLDLANNGLTRLPPAVIELNELQSLDLSENHVDLDLEANITLLASLPHLQRLNLTEAVPDLSISTLERLATLPVLAWVQADLNQLAMTAGHFQALQRWPALSGLSLGQNEIVLDEAGRAALAGLNRLERLHLYENPLALAPDVTGWNQLQQLDLERTGITQWPAGLESLMNQTPMRLTQLDLSQNALTDAPELAQSTFAQAVRDNNANVAYSFAGNPFSTTARARLEAAGLEVGESMQAGPHWYADWPPALQAHVASTAQDAQWQALYALFERLEGSAQYQRSPQAMTQRMQQVLNILAASADDERQTYWGRAQLQQQINDLLEDAGQECVDQASLLFQQIETDVQVWQSVANAAPGESSEAVAVDSAARQYRQQLLDARVAELYQARVARRRALDTALDAAQRESAPPLHPDDDLGDGFLSERDFLLDELEMALYARRRLRTRLNLPTQPDAMHFDYLARLSETTLQRMASAVEADLNADNLSQWVVDQPFWQAWLQRLMPQAFEEQAQAWEGASEYFDASGTATGEQTDYAGPAVPIPFIDALQQEFTDLPALQWYRDGVLQRYDLTIPAYAQREPSVLARMAGVLLQARRAAHQALLERLTRTVVGSHL